MNTEQNSVEVIGTAFQESGSYEFYAKEVVRDGLDMGLSMKDRYLSVVGRFLSKNGHLWVHEYELTKKALNLALPNFEPIGTSMGKTYISEILSWSLSYDEYAEYTAKNKISAKWLVSALTHPHNRGHLSGSQFDWIREYEKTKFALDYVFEQMGKIGWAFKAYENYENYTSHVVSWKSDAKIKYDWLKAISNKRVFTINGFSELDIREDLWMFEYEKVYDMLSEALPKLGRAYEVFEKNPSVETYEAIDANLVREPTVLRTETDLPPAVPWVAPINPTKKQAKPSITGLTRSVDGDDVYAKY